MYNLEKAWNEAYADQPRRSECSRKINIDIVSNRCIYINDTRVWGGKPYASEGLSTTSRETTVRDILSAFSIDDLQQYIAEKNAINAYFDGMRRFRDNLREQSE